MGSNNKILGTKTIGLIIVGIIFIVALVLILGLSKAGQCTKVEVFSQKIDVCQNSQTEQPPPSPPQPQSSQPQRQSDLPGSAPVYTIVGNWNAVGSVAGTRITATDSFNSEGRYQVTGNIGGMQVSDSGSYNFQDGKLSMISSISGLPSSYNIFNLNSNSFSATNPTTGEYYYATRQ